VAAILVMFLRTNLCKFVQFK